MNSSFFDYYLQGEKPAECKTVVVGLYYESHDDNTIDFIKNQLFKLPDVFFDIIGVDFVPWGRTTINAGNDTHPFSCNGGDNECLADRIHVIIFPLFEVKIV